MKKAVIIDDDQGVIEALEAALQLYGFETVGIMKGELAVQTVLKEKPDIIFLDLLLSGIDGVEVAQQLRAQVDIRSIPIIMMSAHPTAESIARTIAVDDFIPKPFDLSTIEQVVGKVLRS